MNEHQSQSSGKDGGGNSGKSLHCGFCKKEQVRQGEQAQDCLWDTWAVPQLSGTWSWVGQGREIVAKV